MLRPHAGAVESRSGASRPQEAEGAGAGAGAGDGLGPSVDAELAVDVLEVLLDGAGGDEQPAAGLGVRETLCDEAEDLELAIGEGLEQVAGGLGRPQWKREG